ncbi:MAG TPA: hypothetical protein VNL77_18280 [Roseiflexaceae bacterium]|nr:hypothetical protein [Roseiflexaceae bacterium]
MALVLALLAPAWPALACTPPPGRLPSCSAAQRARAADVVLEGRVTAVTDGGFTLQTATI